MESHRRQCPEKTLHMIISDRENSAINYSKDFLFYFIFLQEFDCKPQVSNTHKLKTDKQSFKKSTIKNARVAGSHFIRYVCALGL